MRRVAGPKIAAAKKKRGRPKAIAPVEVPKKRGRPTASIPPPSAAHKGAGTGDGGGNSKRRAAVLKAVAEDLQRRSVAPSRPISLRMPEDLYKQVLAAMGEIGERSMSAFLIALTRDALDQPQGD